MHWGEHTKVIVALQRAQKTSVLVIGVVRQSGQRGGSTLSRRWETNRIKDGIMWFGLIILGMDDRVKMPRLDRAVRRVRGS